MYSDCWVDDGRLVVLNALDAAERGADIRVRARSSRRRRRDGERWTRQSARTRDTGETPRGPRPRAWSTPPARGSPTSSTRARRSNTQRKRAPGQGQPHRRAEAVRRASMPIILQNTDKRIVFAIPYQGDFTLIGTTDIAYRRRARRGRDQRRRGDRLSVRRRQPLSSSAADRARGRGLDLFRRAAAVRRRHEQRLGA